VATLVCSTCNKPMRALLTVWRCDDCRTVKPFGKERPAGEPAAGHWWDGARPAGPGKPPAKPPGSKS
jgi:hypothetical protein